MTVLRGKRGRRVPCRACRQGSELNPKVTWNHFYFLPSRLHSLADWLAEWSGAIRKVNLAPHAYHGISGQANCGKF